MDDAGPIDVLSRPGDRPPRLPGRVLVRDTAADAADALAADVFLVATGAARAHSEVHIAIAVSDATIPLMRTLMIDPGLRDFPWDRTHLWLVDEQWGGSPNPTPDQTPDQLPNQAPTSPPDRAILLHEWLVEPSGIPLSHVHTFMPDATAAPSAYADQVRASLIWRDKGSERMDLLLLAPDPSAPDLLPLAPDTRDPVEAGAGLALAAPITPTRVAMTRAMARRSEFIAILATGQPAQEPIAAWSSRRVPFPAMPLAGELRWYLDRDACPS